MPRYPSARLVQQLDRTIRQGYTDVAIYYPEPSGSTGLDDAGQATVSNTGIRIECNIADSIRNRQALESYAEIADTSLIEAEIRFAEDAVTPTKGGQFEFVKKYGKPVDAGAAHRYEIVGIRYRGLLGWMCALRKVDL